MNKLFFAAALLALTITYLLPLPLTVRADGGYALTEEEVISASSNGRAVYGRVNGEVYICTDQELTDKLFILPETYFVKVLEYARPACRVMYCFEDYDYARGVCGYTATDSLLFTLSPPSGKSFPNVFCKFEGNGTFYKNNTFSSYYTASDSLSSDPFFYGYYLRGSEAFCYVLCGGRFGYYSADVFAPVTLEDHPDRMPSVKPPQSTSSTASEDKKAPFFSSDSSKIVIISVCCFIAICAVYAIFLPKKRAREETEED